MYKVQLQKKKEAEVHTINKVQPQKRKEFFSQFSKCDIQDILMVVLPLLPFMIVLIALILLCNMPHEATATITQGDKTATYEVVKWKMVEKNLMELETKDGVTIYIDSSCVVIEEKPKKSDTIILIS